MTDKEEKEFMDKHFKAGEYSVLTLMVNNKELRRLIDVLRASNLNLAILPGVEAKAAFNDTNGDGLSQ